jgi:hypothetical protein
LSAFTNRRIVELVGWSTTVKDSSILNTHARTRIPCITWYTLFALVFVLSEWLTGGEDVISSVWSVGIPTDGTLTVAISGSDLAVLSRAMETLGVSHTSHSRIPNTMWAVSRTVQTDNLVSISSVDVDSVGVGVLSGWASIEVDSVSWSDTGIGTVWSGVPIITISSTSITSMSSAIIGTERTVRQGIAT